MIVNSHVVIRPTFPLDRAEIERRTLVRKLGHPATIGIVVAGLLLALVSKSVIGVLAGTAAAIFGLRAFWKRGDRGLRDLVVRELIARSNREQDRALEEYAEDLRDRGHGGYADVMDRFLSRKQRIDTELHADGTLTRARQDVERLVDLVVNGVCGHVERVAELDADLAEVLTSVDPARLEAFDGLRSGVLREIRRAYRTICETHENVVACAGSPVSGPTLMTDADASHPSLAQAVERLLEENRISRRARERLAAEWGTDAVAVDSAPPSAAQAGEVA